MSKDNYEAEPFGRIQFILERENGMQSIHETNCPLRTRIDGLKDDLESVLKVDAGSQKWIYNGTVLEDVKTLWDYKINGTSQVPSVIYVKV